MNDSKRTLNNQYYLYIYVICIKYKYLYITSTSRVMMMTDRHYKLPNQTNRYLHIQVQKY